MQVGALTESLEDYLEIIFRLVQQNKVARVRDIAKAKDVKNSSVISALQRLAKEGLVDYQAHEYVDLTGDGRELAFRISQRHQFLKTFLMDLLQVDEETAEKDACSMEHAISLATMDRLTAFTEFITYCPKVDRDLIAHFRDNWLTRMDRECMEEHPTSECGVWKQQRHLAEALGIRCLLDLEVGQEGHITRILGRESDRRSIIQRGLLPGANIQLTGRHNGDVSVHIAGEDKTLPKELASAVFLWVSGPQPIAREKDQVKEVRYSLADLHPGSAFRVKRVEAQGEILQRLIDMGFIRGAKGRVVREALLRDPIEIELQGYLLSLRRAEAKDVIIEAPHAKTS